MDGLLKSRGGRFIEITRWRSLTWTLPFAGSVWAGHGGQLPSSKGRQAAPARACHRSSWPRGRIRGGLPLPRSFALDGAGRHREAFPFRANGPTSLAWPRVALPELSRRGCFRSTERWPAPTAVPCVLRCAADAHRGHKVLGVGLEPATCSPERHQ